MQTKIKTQNTNSEIDVASGEINGAIDITTAIFALQNWHEIARIGDGSDRAWNEPEPLKWIFEWRACMQCERLTMVKFFEADSFAQRRLVTCSVCRDRKQAALDAQNLSELERDAHQHSIQGVPVNYHSNDVTRFPAVWAKICQWTPTGHGPGIAGAMGAGKTPTEIGQGTLAGQGLGIVGATDLFKTRMVFARIIDFRREMFKAGRPVSFLYHTGFSLQRAIQGQWHDEAMLATVKEARTVDILFVDDIGKQKFTAATEAELFDIVEYRCARKLPILFTSNLAGKDFESVMSADVAMPLLRRLREFCLIFSVA